MYFICAANGREEGPLTESQIAERIHTRLPDEVDIEDLMSAGVFGLMDAIDAFDLSRKVKFETYCAPRIRGAILDELRRSSLLTEKRTAEYFDRVSDSVRKYLGARYGFGFAAVHAIRIHEDGLDGGADPGHDGVVISV